MWQDKGHRFQVEGRVLYPMGIRNSHVRRKVLFGRVRLRSQRYGWGTNVSSRGLAKTDVADRQLPRGKGATKTDINR